MNVRARQASQMDRVIETARRTPEGLLLVAAGCALLLRQGTRPGSARPPRGNDVVRSASVRAEAERAASAGRELSDQISEAVGPYAEKAAGGVAAARDALAEGSDRLAGQAQRLQDATRRLREQPLLLAISGLAAGAALAAVLRPTGIEQQAAASARETLADAASTAQERVKKAAGQAGEKLKERAAASGLDAAGLTDLAREAVNDAVHGQTEQRTGTRQDEIREGALNPPPGTGEPL